MSIPPECLLIDDEGGNEFPYYFVADTACPLRRSVMRRYPERNTINKKIIYNYRLSHDDAKNLEFSYHPPGVTTCVLHNFIRRRDGVSYTFHTTEENKTLPPRNMTIIEGNVNLGIISPPYIMREYLANYFVQPRNALPWQLNYCIYAN
ncbi:hypothetical protein PR048_007367 [Dryococelus australis]|uniref:Uncharacterized protein n=1 Tax=Dryococelus australis TaxID=614101 RepID=A0ABQ9HU25_9NEOP|nr:hypothetical protein PR048_007367 [Dryococelus australis]